MRATRASLSVCLGACVLMAAGPAAGDEEDEDVRYIHPAALPPAAALLIGERMAHPEYVALLTEATLRGATPETLHALAARAAEAGELYKALYLLSLLAESGWQPEVTAENLRAVSTALGLARVDCPAGAGTGVAFAAGALRSEPVSLADWASALQLTSRSLQVTSGAAVAVVFNDVSGIRLEATDPAKAYFVAEPVRVQDVLPNLQQLLAAQPMDVKGGGGKALKFIAGAALGAGAGYLASMSAAANTLLSMGSASGELIGRALGSQKYLAGGSWRVRPIGVPGPASSGAPVAAGGYSAIRLPVPVAWASGDPSSLWFEATWLPDDDAPGLELDLEDLIKKRSPLDSAAQTSDEISLDEDHLHFVRAARLCIFRDCSEPIFPLEVILDRDDLDLLAPNLRDLAPDLSRYRREYVDPASLLVLRAAASNPLQLDERLLAFDEDGTLLLPYVSATSTIDPTRRHQGDK